MQKHTIDAQGKRLGRVATKAAHFLMGKDDPKFQRNVTADVEVEVVNASGLLIDTKKKRQKEYTRYTGYPGGLRKERMGHLIERRGIGEAVRRAVRGMLPGNKLRDRRLKHLKINE